jgi:ATP-binding cassette, subfamily C, bacterial CydC
MKTILRLSVFLKPFVGSVLLPVLLGTATIVCGIGLLGTSAYLIASAALHPSIAVLEVAIVGVRFFGIGRGIARYFERLASHSVNFKLLANLRTWFYLKLEPLAPARLAGRSSGDVLARAIADIDTLENFYIRLVAPPVLALIVMAGMGWFTGQFQPGLAWILVGGMALTGTLAPGLVYLASRQPSKDWIESRSALFETMVEGVQGLEDLLAYNQADGYLEKVWRASLSARRAQLRLAWSNGWSAALNLLIPDLTLWCMLLAAIPLVAAGRLDGVTLVVIFLTGMAGFEAVTPLSGAAQTLESSLQAARRIFSLADSQPVVPEPARPCSPPQGAGLSVRGLTFRYADDLQPALDKVSFDLPPGQQAALVGPSGSGKTTLSRLLLRFWDCPPGTIVLNGRDIRDFQPAHVRARIACLPDPVYLFGATLRQNLLLARPGAAPADLEGAIQTAGLADWFASLPDGLDTWIGEHGLQVSGGERQRIGIARLVLQDAQLYILDEPLSGLDALSAQRLSAVIKSVTSGKSVLWITHRLVDLQDMHTILVLDKGRLVEQGTHARLIQQRGLYWRMRSVQPRLQEDGEL